MIQILTNLLTNAVDAIEQKKQEDGRIFITITQDGEHLVLDCSDNGVGIKDEDLQSLTRPFYTTKSADKGTGLGLSLSQRYVQGNHGELSFLPQAEGAWVRLKFPVHKT